MSPASHKLRRATILTVAVLGLAGGAVTLARWVLLPWALGAALKAGGATEVSFDVTRASPWLLQVANLGFHLDAAKFAAPSASLERRHWWTPSLGRLHVQEARVDVELKPAGASTPVAKPSSPAAPLGRIPLEEISIDGRVTVRAGDELSQTLVVSFAARPVTERSWGGRVTATAPGLDLGAEATYDLAGGKLDFHATTLRIEVQPWQAWLEHWAPLPGGPWELGGTLTGSADGHYRDGQFAAQGGFHLRAARVANPGLGLTAEGVEADIEIADLSQWLARQATVRAKTVTSGKIVLTDLAAEFSRTESGRFDVAVLSAHALGGSLSVEPFVYRLGDTGVEAVVSAEDIQAEQVMALTQDLPARASGPLSGRLPVRYDANGFRFGTGWLGLKPGASAEIQFHAGGLLTAGTSPKSPSYAVLKKVEDGILKLKVTELRLDIRPPDAPAGRTAQLHVVGAPVDPEVKAPVTLDLNVNGPLESLLNLGMKSGVSFGK